MSFTSWLLALQITTIAAFLKAHALANVHRITMRAFFSRWKRLKVPVAPKPSVLLESERRAYQQERPPRSKDNPLSAVYRIYWAIVMDEVFTMRNEIEYFWHQHAWKVCDIPDPADPEPERAAFVAAIPFILVTAFNNLINRGLPRDLPSIFTTEELDQAMLRAKKPERAPSWAENSPPLQQTFFLPDKDGKVLESFDDEFADEHLAKKNILAHGLHILFV